MPPPVDQANGLSPQPGAPPPAGAPPGGGPPGPADGGAPGMAPPIGGGLAGRAPQLGKIAAAQTNIQLGVGFLMMGVKDLPVGHEMGLIIHKFINDLSKHLPPPDSVSGQAQGLMALRQRAMGRGGQPPPIMPGQAPSPGGGPPGGGPAGAPVLPGPAPAPTGAM